MSRELDVIDMLDEAAPFYIRIKPKKFRNSTGREFRITIEDAEISEVVEFFRDYRSELEELM